MYIIQKSFSYRIIIGIERNIKITYYNILILNLTF